eukprot:8445052-Prorocentrum_lima.AAC.1
MGRARASSRILQHLLLKVMKNVKSTHPAYGEEDGYHASAQEWDGEEEEWEQEEPEGYDDED